MTLPSSRLPRLDAMAVSTPHHTPVAHDFGFHRRNRFELGDIRSLSNHMVNIESRGVSIVPTVDAPALGFEVRDPRLHRTRPLIRDHVVSRLGLGVGNPLPVVAPTCVGIIGAFRARPACAQRRAVFGVGSLRSERNSTLHARPFGGWRVSPGRHTSIISYKGFANPCKPDIFEDTYERVGIRGEQND